MHGLKVVYSVSPTSVASFINVSNTGINEYQNLHKKVSLLKIMKLQGIAVALISVIKLRTQNSNPLST